MDINFNLIKDEILQRAKEARACAEQYARAYKAETMQDLCNVIKDNFDWAHRNKVIDTALLMLYRDDFAKNGIFVNTSVSKGYLLCDNATVEAWDNATVKAWDNAYVSSYAIVECKLSGNAIYRIRRDNIIRFASDSLKFEKI